MATTTVLINTNSSLTFTINYVAGTASNINWGDGSPLDTVTDNSISHTYGSVGNFTITFDSTLVTLLQIISQNVTSIDVSFNTNLQTLYCDFNILTNLNVNGCTSLGVITSSFNQLTSIDVSTNSSLTQLSIGYNQLTSLNVSGLSSLLSLFCNNNQLTSLNVSGCTSLQNLYCYNNQIPSLNVNGFTALNFIDCSNNLLTSLDVSTNSSLGTLSCGYNLLTSINVSTLTSLLTFFCNSNQLSFLDVSTNTSLQNLVCASNLLTSLNLGTITSLTSLDCRFNQLTSLDVTNLTNLSYLQCQNNQLNGLNLTSNTSLVQLYCMNNLLTSLNLSFNTSLQYLYCSFNSLSVFNVNLNTLLVHLHCDNNLITSLDVTSNTLLTELITGFNQITNLDVSFCPSLALFDCRQNLLTSLILSTHTNLYYLDFSQNLISSINLNGLPIITNLKGYNNQLTNLDITFNPNLSEVDINNNNLTSSAIDLIFSGLANNSVSFGFLDVASQTPPVTLSPQALIDKGTLESRGWNVITQGNNFWYARPCIFTATTITVDDATFPANIGDVVDTNSPYGCVTIFSSAPVISADFDVTSTNAGSCLNCVGGGNYFLFSGCPGTNNGIFPVQISSFSFTPQLDKVYKFTLKDINTGVEITNCFGLIGVSTSFFTTRYNLLGGLPLETYNNCSSCTGPKPVSTIIVVEPCFPGDNICVEVTGDYNIGDLISFNVEGGLDNLCGIINSANPNCLGPLNTTFIQNFGSVECLACFSANSVVRTVSICTGDEPPPGSYYFSPFLNEGDVINIAGDNICYIVGPISEIPPFPFFIPYSPPFPSCEQCYICSQDSPKMVYETTCNEIPTTGSVYTFQIIPSGTTFYHPKSGCSTVLYYTYFTTETDFNVNLDAVLTFNDCTECLSTPINVYELTSNCLNAGFTALVTKNTYNVGDVVKTQFGSGEFLCSSVGGPYSGAPYDRYTINFNNTVYPADCTDCFVENNIGITLRKCSDNSISYFAFNVFEILSIVFFQNKFILKDSNETCYYFDDQGCFFTQNFLPNFTVIESFSACTDCVPLPPPDRFSAGTEYFMCVPDCSGNTISVPVPHPTWTNNQGQTIVLLDAVVLGGQNGLYN